jgi:hypothetical protein
MSEHPAQATDLSVQLVEIDEQLREIQAELAGEHGPGAVTLSAGPFATIAALHSFEQALAGLAEVREVTLRAFDGADRVILDVQLERPAG